MTKVAMPFCVLAILLVPGLAMADVAGPFTTTTPITATVTDWTGSLSFPQFNPALGTLVSVDLQLNGAMETVLTITNLASESSNGTAKTEVQMTIQDVLGTLPVPAIDMFSPDYSYTLAAGATATSGTLTKTGSFSDTYTAPAVLAEFTGPGTVLLNASTFTKTWLTNTGGNTAVDQVTSAALTGTVTYNYETPEPATLSLLGLGLATLLRRRR